MSDIKARATAILDHNASVIREVIASSESVVADLSGNADDRLRGGYILIEADRVRRLVAAVHALDSISLPTT